MISSLAARLASQSRSSNRLSVSAACDHFNEVSPEDDCQNSLPRQAHPIPLVAPPSLHRTHGVDRSLDPLRFHAGRCKSRRLRWGKIRCLQSAWAACRPSSDPAARPAPAVGSPVVASTAMSAARHHPHLFFSRSRFCSDTGRYRTVTPPRSARSRLALRSSSRWLSNIPVLGRFPSKSR